MGRFFKHLIYEHTFSDWSSFFIILDECERTSTTGQTARVRLAIYYQIRIIE